jgi:hypothetical protein
MCWRLVEDDSVFPSILDVLRILEVWITELSSWLGKYEKETAFLRVFKEFCCPNWSPKLIWLLAMHDVEQLI